MSPSPSFSSSYPKYSVQCSSIQDWRLCAHSQTLPSGPTQTKLVYANITHEYAYYILRFTLLTVHALHVGLCIFRSNVGYESISSAFPGARN